MYRWNAITALVVAALLVTPAIARANDSAMGGAGGAVKPITSSTIRMEAETVQVILYGKFAEYQVDFRFVNKGAPQRVKLGFPFPVPPEEGDYSPPAAFRAWQGDRQLAVTYREIPEGDGKTGYFLHEAQFPTGATMIRVRYYAYPDTAAVEAPPGLIPPTRFAGEYSLSGSYPYTVHTGAGWSGTIGTSVIRYYISSDAIAWGFEPAIEVRAKEYAQDGWAPKGAADILRSYTKPAPNVYQWKFSDFEPTPNGDGLSRYDVELPFYIPGEGETTSAWAPFAEVTASSELKLSGYEYLARQAVDGDPSTAWAEGAKGPGTGQTLEVRFPAIRRVRELRVLPGYAKREDLFRKYDRPRTLTVAFSDGTTTRLDLKDEPTLQRFPVRADAEWAKVTIGDVYRGTTRDETYLSEIEFGTAAAPMPLPFETVLAGGLDSGEATAGEANGASTAADLLTTTSGPGAGIRLPQQLRDPGWPLFAVAVGCGLLAGIAIGVALVLVARRGRIAQEGQETGAPAGPPGPAGPPA